MPLSEHEQRLLEQMERALYAEDPKFATALRGADPRTHYRRRAYQAIVGFVIGVALLMTGVMTEIAVSVVGFLIMLACALLAVTSWRRIPTAGEVATSVPRKFGRRPPRQRVRMMDRIEARWRRRRDEQQGGM